MCVCVRTTSRFVHGRAAAQALWVWVEGTHTNVLSFCVHVCPILQLSPSHWIKRSHPLVFRCLSLCKHACMHACTPAPVSSNTRTTGPLRPGVGGCCWVGKFTHGGNAGRVCHKFTALTPNASLPGASAFTHAPRFGSRTKHQWPWSIGANVSQCFKAHTRSKSVPTCKPTFTSTHLFPNAQSQTPPDTFLTHNSLPV